MSSLKYTTYAGSTVGSAYTSGDGTLTVASGQGSRFPSTGDFWLRINNANGTIRKVTSRSSDVLTFAAGTADGTTDANAAIGITVDEVLGATAIDQLRVDISGSGTLANLPTPEKAGNLWLPTDSISLARDNGSAQQYWGPIWPHSGVPSSGWSWDRAASDGTIVSGNGIEFLQTNGTSNSWWGRYRAYPNSAPLTVTAMFRRLYSSTNDLRCGLYLRESSDGKAVGCWVGRVSGSIGGQGALSKFNANLAWSADYAYSTAGKYFDIGSFPCDFWLRAIDDNTNITFSFSTDGYNFITIDIARSRTDWMTAGPNQWGFFLATSTAGGIGSTGLSLVAVRYS